MLESALRISSAGDPRWDESVRQTARIALVGGTISQFRGEANSVAGEIKKPGENYDDGKAEDNKHD